MYDQITKHDVTIRKYKRIYNVEILKCKAKQLLSFKCDHNGGKQPPNVEIISKTKRDNHLGDFCTV